MNKKQIVKAAAFLIVLLAVWNIVTGIFIPKWTTGTSITYLTDEFYQTKKNTVEVGIIGSSQLVNGISCGRLLDEYGISAFSCATGEQPALCGWFYLLELDRLQDIKAVIYDTSMLYEPEEEVRFRKTLDTAPMSINKLRLIAERSKSQDSSSVASYLFPLMKYHTRWSQLKYEDFSYKNVNTEMFWGNIYGGKVNRNASYDKICVDNEIPDLQVKMDENELAAFEKIVSYCEDKDIALVLVKTPKSTWERAKTDGCQELADAYGLPYIDFNRGENLQAIGFDVGNDMWNQDHLNVRGADKLTDYMGAYLKEHYVLSDFRESPDYDAGKMERFRIERSNKYLQTTIQVEEYLERLREDRLEILVQKSGDFSDAFSKELQEKVKALGVTVDFSQLNGQYYAAQLRNGAAVFEQIQSDPVEADIVFADGNSGVVKSSTDDPVLMAAVGKKVPFSYHGLNILAYDKENHTVADIATIYVNEEGTLMLDHDVQEVQEQ